MRYSSSNAQVTVTEERRPGRLCISWAATDAATFHELKASFRATFARHGEAIWVLEDKCWSVPAWLSRRLDEWIARTFEPAAVEWTGDRHTGRAYERQEPAEARAPATLARAFRALHLTPDAPLWAAEAVHRAGVKRCHPDVGGDHDEAVALNSAIALIRQRAS